MGYPLGLSIFEISVLICRMENSKSNVFEPKKNSSELEKLYWLTRNIGYLSQISGKVQIFWEGHNDCFVVF